MVTRKWTSRAFWTFRILLKICHNGIYATIERLNRSAQGTRCRDDIPRLGESPPMTYGASDRKTRVWHYLDRISSEPPFRLAARWIVQKFSKDIAARARWGTDPYPYYQFGIVEGARLAQLQDHSEITVIEFGVWSGRGLLKMEEYAGRVELATGVSIKVVGFDSGGLPSFIGDYRDHPDQWKPGDYKVPNFDELQKQIDNRRTRLIIGDVRETVPIFLQRGNYSPIGFISFDLDLYSSTRDALEILGNNKRKMLRQTPLYFDDIDFITNHRWAGVLLAVEEFNKTCYFVKIDRWHNLTADKPFPEAHHWEKMMVAHDLHAITAYGAEATRALTESPR